MKSSDYKKLSPKKLRELGYSPKSERYQNALGHTIGKGKYQRLQLAEKHGRPVSLAERAKNFLFGIWQYVTGRQKVAAEARRKQAKKKRGVAGGITPLDYAIERIKELRREYDRDGELSENSAKELRDLMKKWGTSFVMTHMYPV